MHSLGQPTYMALLLRILNDLLRDASIHPKVLAAVDEVVSAHVEVPLMERVPGVIDGDYDSFCCRIKAMGLVISTATFVTHAIRLKLTTQVSMADYASFIMDNVNLSSTNQELESTLDVLEAFVKAACLPPEEAIMTRIRDYTKELPILRPSMSPRAKFKLMDLQV
jgi:hypothetical protein